jgi:hypothetical protein
MSKPFISKSLFNSLKNYNDEISNLYNVQLLGNDLFNIEGVSNLHNIVDTIFKELLTKEQFEKLQDALYEFRTKDVWSSEGKYLVIDNDIIYDNMIGEDVFVKYQDKLKTSK